MEHALLDDLVEQRIIEATKKNIANKLWLVAKNLGKPIISQGIFSNPITTPEDIIYDSGEIATVSEEDDWNIYNRGYYFDGLRYGVNFCITADAYEDKMTNIKATFNGYLVFAEVEGEIRAYAPFPAWESPLTMFYVGALKYDTKLQRKESYRQYKERKSRFATFWENFRQLWNF